MTEPLPPIASTALPQRLQGASPERQKDYRSALAFERTFALQLAKQMLSETSDDAPAAVKMMREQLPGTLADAMIGAGGFGLADQIDRAMHPEAQRTSIGARPEPGTPTPTAPAPADAAASGTTTGGAR